MPRIAFTQPRARKITPEDLEVLPLKKTHIRVLKVLLDLQYQRKQEGVGVSQGELAKMVRVSRSTVGRALKEASEKSYILIFDTYIKGIGAAPSRIYFHETILYPGAIELAKKNIPPRISQLKGKDFKDCKPTLILEFEDGEPIDQYWPTPELRWPVYDGRGEFTSQAKYPQTYDECITELRKQQQRQEGVSYIRDNSTPEEKNGSYELALRNYFLIMEDPALLGTFLFSNRLAEKDINRKSSVLHVSGVSGWCGGFQPLRKTARRSRLIESRQTVQ